MSIANRTKENYKQLIRDIFAGTAKRHAFLYQPPLMPLAEAEVGDFTLSSEPVRKLYLKFQRIIRYYNKFGECRI